MPTFAVADMGSIQSWAPSVKVHFCTGGSCRGGLVLKHSSSASICKAIPVELQSVAVLKIASQSVTKPKPVTCSVVSQQCCVYPNADVECLQINTY